MSALANTSLAVIVGGATQTVTLDSFEITDLRAW